MLISVIYVVGIPGFDICVSLLLLFTDLFRYKAIDYTGQMAQVVRCLLLVREVWGSNSEPIKSPTRCQRLATVAALMCGPWRIAAELGTSHSWHPKGYYCKRV